MNLMLRMFTIRGNLYDCLMIGVKLGQSL